MQPTRHNLFQTLLLGLALVLTAACGKSVYDVPASSTPASDRLDIFPDYTDVVIPPNIAPLNFMVRNAATAVVAELQCDGRSLVASGTDKIQWDMDDWKAFLAQAKGRTMTCRIYAEQDGGWRAYPAFSLAVADEEIDPYLSYRLIEPGFELYRQLGLYQRNLTTFEQKPIYENNRDFESEHNHCVNCHNYQAWSTRNMLFHVRSKHGGTVISYNGRIEKLNMKTDSTYGAAVYPSWHPTEPLIAFSTNRTGQVFHILNKEKIEVVDMYSDLLLYNVQTHEISNIVKTHADLETFPCWNAAGDRLYYCTAYVPRLTQEHDSMAVNVIVSSYDSIHYNLMSIPFDLQNMTFGEPQMEFDCAAQHRSASVPRVSPDGRYVLFTLADYGQFHIWHKSADLYVKDLQTDTVRPLTAANSPDVDAYHTWSSNGRWIVFSSRRDDGSFTRAYITYFDTDGQAHKAFMLPQEDPEQNILLLKSYNVPELTKDAVEPMPDEFRKVIYETEGQPIKYKEIRRR